MGKHPTGQCSCGERETVEHVMVACRVGSGHRRTRRSPGAPSAGGAQKFNSQSEKNKIKFLFNFT